MESFKIKFLILLSMLLNIMFIVFVLFITGCNNNNDIKSIIEDKNTIIIDVRTEEEYNERHIDRAINIPVDNIQNIKIEKNKTIVVYCRSGVRSKKAYDILISMGYTDVHDLGGIDNYKKEND